MSGILKSESQQLVARCTCGNSSEHEGIYPCDDHGHKLESSDLVYCNRCDKITVRETGRVVRCRSFLVSACGGF